jgi:hypothetical protein
VEDNWVEDNWVEDYGLENYVVEEFFSICTQGIILMKFLKSTRWGALRARVSPPYTNRLRESSKANFVSISLHNSQCVWGTCNTTHNVKWFTCNKKCPAALLPAFLREYFEVK